MPDPSLDVLDPPAWGRAPSQATFLIRRCHELRSKPLDEFTVEDLRIMIGQQIGLRHLVPMALQRLGADPRVAGDFFPGDLLASVLRVDRGFWREYPALARQLRTVLDDLEADSAAKLEPTMRDLIDAFDRAALA